MTTRRSSPPKPAAPVLTAEQIRRRIDRLQKCIDDLESFDPETVQKRDGVPQVMALERAIDGALEAAFGHQTPAYNRFRAAAHLDHGPRTVSSDWWGGGGRFAGYGPHEVQEARRYFAEGKAQSTALLLQAICDLENEIADKEPVASTPIVQSRSKIDARKIFVVHGHEEGPREAVARFVQALGFQPIILNETANEGRTVIEKVEAHGDVGFAVVLLTPDDEGCVRGGTPASRARQNVVLELGYFIGRLGRDRVCALKRGEVEIPSDFGGVVYEPFDAAGGWKQKLGRELEAAKYEIDWNMVMRS